MLQIEILAVANMCWDLCTSHLGLDLQMSACILCAALKNM